MTTTKQKHFERGGEGKAKNIRIQYTGETTKIKEAIKEG